MSASLAFLYLAGSLLGYYALHSALSTAAVKHRVERHFPRLYAHYRLAYNGLALLGLAAIAWLYAVLPFGKWLWPPAWPTVLPGVLLLLVGFLVAYYGFKGYRWREFAGLEKQPPRHEQLQTTGLNAWVRHPLYSGTVLLLLALVLVLGHEKVVLFSGISLLYLLVGPRWEEKKLMRQFGSAYREYRREVGYLTPRLKTIQTKMFKT